MEREDFEVNLTRGDYSIESLKEDLIQDYLVI